MSSLATILSRRIVLSTVSRHCHAAPMLITRATLATINLPDHDQKIKENPQGPMYSGYDEVLDEMIAKTEAMETQMKQLRGTYDQKRQAVLQSNTVKWMDADEIEGLFDLAGRQKKEMEEQLQEMKRVMEAAKTNFAVDAPDGENDGHIEEEIEEVNHIIEEAAAQKKRATN